MATEFPPPSISHLDFGEGDLMALVEMVMLQCAKTNADVLRDIMASLAAANKAKAAKREQLSALKKGRASADAESQREFYALLAAGDIGDGWTLEEFQSQRAEVWGDGEAVDGHWLGPAPKLSPLSATLRAQFALPKVRNAADRISGGSDADATRTADANAADAEFDSYAIAQRLHHRGTFKQLDAEIESQQGALDSMGDLTQLMQMRLQKYLDAYSKMFEMLSNVMKKISQTMDDIAQNMK